MVAPPLERQNGGSGGGTVVADDGFWFDFDGIFPAIPCLDGCVEGVVGKSS